MKSFTKIFLKTSSPVVIGLVAMALLLLLVMNFNLVRSVAAASALERAVDFNGDGYEDLVIGVPDEGLNHNTIENAGLVNVIHGTSEGISAIPIAGTGLVDQTWNQNSPDVNGVAQDNEDFGYSVAAGDYNGDGYSDLAIGNPASTSGGEVNVIYGSSAFGLTPTAAPVADQIFWLGAPNIDGSHGQTDSFGYALSAGDFNNDGYDDLAIGNPWYDILTNIGTQFDAGAVNVIYGSSEGLSSQQAGDATGRTDQFWSQNTFGIQDVAENFDFFGSSLTTGDFNDDGYDDLAIGVPGEDPFASSQQFDENGGTNIIYGSPNGLSATFVPNQFFGPLTDEIDAHGSSRSQFGYSLVAADFNGDDYDDLAIGVPGDIVESCNINGCSGEFDVGAVNVIYGSSQGLSPTLTMPDQIWSQASPDIEGDIHSGDFFGTSLSAGDFNNDGYADLAVGTPKDDVAPAVSEVGAVNVIYGSPDGLSATFVPNQYIHQNSQNVDEAAALSDDFGQALTTGDYNGDGFCDLAIGVPGEDVNHDSIADAGAVNIIYGSSEGLSATGAGDSTGRTDQILTQNTSSVNDSSEEDDKFGWSLG